MSGGNKRRRKKCHWNICHLGINVVQSCNSFIIAILKENKRFRSTFSTSYINRKIPFQEILYLKNKIKYMF